VERGMACSSAAAATGAPPATAAITVPTTSTTSRRRLRQKDGRIPGALRQCLQYARRIQIL
jgi:hypothetical protein